MFVVFFFKLFFIRFLCCCFQARANRGWSTSASTSASPATSACPSASTTYQSDCVLSSSPPSTRSGKQSCLFSSLYKKKKKKKNNKKKRQNKSQLWLFSFVPYSCQRTNEAANSPSPSSISSEREETETGCHGYRQSPVVTLFMCNTLSGGTHQRLQKKDPPFLCVFPVTHCCSVIMHNCSCWVFQSV